MAIRGRKRYLKQKIRDLKQDRDDIFLIHYACQGFDRVKTGAPEISAIVIRNFQTRDFYSFTRNNFETEEELLQEYNEFIRQNRRKIFVHWNMNNDKYGFGAINIRYRKLLGHKPYAIGIKQLYDLDDLVEFKYGEGYVPHKKFDNLIKKSGLYSDDYKKGAEEAKLYDEGKFYDLQNSVITKVNLLGNILEKFLEDTLETDNKTTRSFSKIVKWAIGIFGTIFLSVIANYIYSWLKSQTPQ